MKEQIIFYLKNGDIYMGDHYLRGECLDILRENGYKEYYCGVKRTNKQSVIVGIDENNTVTLEQRAQNGLLCATKVNI